MIKIFLLFIKFGGTIVSSIQEKANNETSFISKTFKIWNEEIVTSSWYYYNVTETSPRHYGSLILCTFLRKESCN